MKDPYTELFKYVTDSRSILRHSYVVPSLAQEPVKLNIKLPQNPEPKRPSSKSEGRPVLDIPAIQSFAIPVDLANLSGTEGMEQLSAMVRSCTKCGLCKTRTKAVPGTGSMRPLVMVIGEGPGADEDRLGLPFVGAAGQFLDKWLEAIGLSRYQNAFIANTIKCRPPQNRDPLPDESSACSPYLATQIRLLQPKAILTVGRYAASFLAGDTIRIGEIHGQFFTYQNSPWMPTYHPSAVLRNPDLKRPVWQDLKNFKASILDTLDAGGG